ncbi:MAG: MFS transporter [Anaerolineales bacterium]|jgi:fucose permease
MTEIRQSIRSSSVYFTVYFLLGVTIALIGASMPYLAEMTGVEVTSLGYLFSTRSFGYLLGAFIAGRLYDRYPGHLLMAGLMAMIGLAAVFMPFSATTIILAVLMFLTGMGLGGSDLGGNTLVMWRFKERSGPFINGMFFFSGLGGILAPLMLELVLRKELYFGWAYWILAISILLVVIWLLARQSPGIPEVDALLGDGTVNFRLVALFGVMLFIFVSIEVSFGGWIYSYVLATEGGNSSLAAYLTSGFWLAVTLGRLAMIPVTIRIKQRAIIWVSMSGVAFFLAVILLNPGSFVVDFIGTLGLGLFFSSLSPVTLSYAERSLPIHGRITGILWVFGSAGAIVTPWLAGKLMGLTDPVALVVLLFVYTVIGLIVFLGLNLYQSRCPNFREGNRVDT